MGLPTPAPTVPTPGLVYRFAAWLAFCGFRLQRLRFDTEGLEHVPTSGGAVIAANHHSFADMFAVGRGPYLGYGRPIRILAKASLWNVPVFGRLMQAAGHIPVERGAGTHAWDAAVEALQGGELVLVLPEQTISPSFELLPFKTGAVRMAAAAGVPLIPAVSWGTHRMNTMGRRPRFCWRLPVTVRYAPPVMLAPDVDPFAVSEDLRQTMQAVLDQVITSYSDGTPAGAWWVPARFGGGAPTPTEADQHLAERHRFHRAPGDVDESK